MLNVHAQHVGAIKPERKREINVTTSLSSKKYQVKPFSVYGFAFL